MRTDSPCRTAWGHGCDTLGRHSSVVTTGDRRRSAVTDVTANPGDTTPNEGASRFQRVVSAAETVATCRMMGRPVPQATLDAPH